MNFLLTPVRRPLPTVFLILVLLGTAGKLELSVPKPSVAVADAESTAEMEDQ